MKRIAIILSKQLERGQVGNVAAILMGEASLGCPEIYADGPVIDRTGNCHASIRYSTVLLEAHGPGQILNFVQQVKLEHPSLTRVLFSAAGQGLNNAFEEYQAVVSAKATEELNPVGILLVGEDDEVRRATKKFSLMRSRC